MTNRIGIAVIGAGRWGVHLVRNFLEHPQARLIAVIDPDPESLATLRQRFNFDEQVILATDWSALPPPPELAAVAIATPATTHYALITTALKQGYHVLAEKPLTLALSESQQLCRLAAMQQRQLVVDHTYLFHPAVERGRAVVRSGVLGELRYGYAARTHLGPVRPDVDALWDLAIHDIAIFNTWLGETPTQVQAQGQVWLQTRSPNQDYFPQGLADLVWVTLVYPSGFQASLHLCWLNPDKQRRLGVVGSQGTLVFDELAIEAPLTIQHGQLQPLASNQLSQAELAPTYYTPIEQRREILSLEPGEPLQQVCTHFLDCVRHNIASPISSGLVGAELVRVLNGLTESLNQSGQLVLL
ncbi:Gfo/Idh/MocA family protein [Trichocoleus sp. FACHB-262]|uniref:Gfo/Idh/MocA family protein n=1 Tax=Trichocoleus sp. FACHB-262 TaxID=2692869 RepID=UPI001687959D|nr:Gfo/Idh/MocA family oxidoreductase [Trichocoleus sp. FACHB-262]MBD2119809.1 Gfo/Idh/MocA family oxidoreductase [Trichocoleus sp. FACHB-262]